MREGEREGMEMDRCFLLPHYDGERSWSVGHVVDASAAGISVVEEHVCLELSYIAYSI